MVMRLVSVVTRTTLDTRSASLSYFVARTDERTAAGIAEFRITMDFNIPERSKICAIKIPSSRPTPILRNVANRVVGNEDIFTFERLYPRVMRIRGSAMRPMKLSGIIII
jgi:hypothetical protein